MQNKPRMLLSDFDGTLIDHDEMKLSDSVTKSIRNMIDNGYMFSIATGRGYPGELQMISKQLELKTPIISRGSSEINDPQTGKVLWGTFIEKKTLRRL